MSVKRSTLDISHGRVFHATVIDVVKSRCSVRLAKNGQVLRGLAYSGGPLQAGDACLVSYASGTPVALAIGRTQDVTGVRNPIRAKAVVSENLGGGGGAETFISLTDTPDSYTDQGGKYPRVKPDESGIEFVEPINLTGETTVLVGLKLADVTVGAGGAASITTGVLPSLADYTRLTIHLLARSDKSGFNTDTMTVYLNSDTNDANYRRNIFFNVSAHGAGDNSFVGTIPAATALSGDFGQYQFEIDEPGSSRLHAMSVRGMERREATEQYVWWGEVFWEGAAAISSLMFQPSSPNKFVQNTRLVVIGWKEITLSGFGISDHTLLDNIGENSHAQIDAHLAATTGAHGGIREKLAANRTYYVKQASDGGSDANDGLTVGTAFATIQKAVDVVAELDINGKSVVIQVSDGSYPNNIALKNVVGFSSVGNLVLRGNTSTPANVLINVTGSCITAIDISTVWKVEGFKLQATGSGLYASNAGLQFANMNFGACTRHIYSFSNGLIVQYGNYTISGNATFHINVDHRSMANMATYTVTIDGDLTFTTYAEVGRLSYLRANLTTFTYTSGSSIVSGKSYNVTENSVIFSNGGGTKYFPCVTDGTTGSGGQHI